MKWPTLEKRRKVALLTMMFKVVSGHQLHWFPPCIRFKRRQGTKQFHPKKFFQVNAKTNKYSNTVLLQVQSDTGNLYQVASLKSSQRRLSKRPSWAIFKNANPGTFYSLFTWHSHSSSETKGPIKGARESLNGRKNIYGTRKSKERREELFAPFCTFLRATFFHPFRLSFAPTICPWVSEDAFALWLYLNTSTCTIAHPPWWEIPFADNTIRIRIRITEGLPAKFHAFNRKWWTIEAHICSALSKIVFKRVRGWTLGRYLPV